LEGTASNADSAEAATSKVHVRQIQARHVTEYLTKHVRQDEANDGMSESVKTVVAGRGRSLGPSKWIAYGGCVDAGASKFAFMHAIFEYCVLACQMNSEPLHSSRIHGIGGVGNGLKKV
jgi:hypothetical protein